MSIGWETYLGDNWREHGYSEDSKGKEQIQQEVTVEILQELAEQKKLSMKSDT